MRATNAVQGTQRTFGVGKEHCKVGPSYSARVEEDCETSSVPGCYVHRTLYHDVISVLSDRTLAR